MKLPHTYHCPPCGSWLYLPERPERIPVCESCGRIQRAAWERDGEEHPEWRRNDVEANNGRSAG